MPSLAASSAPASLTRVASSSSRARRRVGGGGSRIVATRTTTPALGRRDGRYERLEDGESMAYDPSETLSDVLRRADEARSAKTNDWASSLAAYREEAASKERQRSEMGAELAAMERVETARDDLIDTVWVNDAGSVARKEFKGLQAGEDAATFGDDEADFIDFGGDDDDVWDPSEGGFGKFIEVGDDDIFEPREEKSRGIPREMRCFDTAKIFVKAGDGGDGQVAFRREKFVQQGGPSGGNGGLGGGIYFVGDKNINSLDIFRKKVHHRAEGGKRGLGDKMAGRNGRDLEILVPPGTIIRDSRTQKIIGEITKGGQRVLALVGGRGGRGNASFKTAKNKAPMIAELGEKGKEFWAELELKLVADVGIIGVPNAGKSTLLASVSAAKPKIADYPFTTIVPNLGVVDRDYERMVFADIPGILEGASEGVGLGFEFLRHTKRTRVLIHVIDCTSETCLEAYEAIRTELELFDAVLLDKPEIVALNKVDDVEATERALQMKEMFDAQGVTSHCISAVTGEGVEELLGDVQAALRALPPVEDEWEAEVAETGKRAADGKSIEEFEIEDTPYAFIVRGDAIERFTQMTNWDYYESYKRFARVLEMAGIDRALDAAGAGEGDRILVGDYEFEWSKDRRDRTLYESFRQRQADLPGAARGSRHWPHAA